MRDFVPEPDSAATVLGAARRQVGRLAAVICAVDVLLPVGLVLYATASGKHYSEPFYEDCGAIGWVSSLQLLIVGCAAYANYQTTLLLDRLRPAGPPEKRRIWIVFAAAFLFLALDERFEIHEMLRDGLLKPAGWFTRIPFVAAGDVVLYAYFVAGLAATLLLFRELRRFPLALGLFVAALPLSLATVIVDSLEERVTDEWADGYFWTAIFEEVGELWAQSLFLLAFFVVLRANLARLARRTGGSRS